MKNAISWIKVFRMHDALFSTGLVYISLLIQPHFENINKNNLYLFLAIIFLGVCVSMSMNDWFDRKKDLAKGKRFASDNANKLLLVNISIWILAGLLIWNLHQGELKIMIPLLLIHYTLSLLYSLFQRAIFLPTAIVALSVSSLMLYAIFLPNSNIYLIAITFLVLFLIIFIREIIKDLLDIDSDKGYKQTIPLVFGKKIAINTCLGLLIAVSIIMIMSNYANIFTMIPVILTILNLKKEHYHDAKIASNYIMASFFLIVWLA